MADHERRSRRCAATPWSRTAAVLVGSMAVVLGASRLGFDGVPRYDAIPVGTAVVLSLFAGLKMWRDNCFESRLVAVVVGVLVVASELLSLTVGGPGGRVTPSPTEGVVLVVLGILVLLVIGADARFRARAQTEGPPYAL